MPDEAPSLLDDLRTAGAGLTGNHVPVHHELGVIVGAIIASLEQAGLKVAEELLNPPDPQPVGPVSGNNLEDTVAKLQARLDQLDKDAAARDAELDDERKRVAELEAERDAKSSAPEPSGPDELEATHSDPAPVPSPAPPAESSPPASAPAGGIDFSQSTSSGSGESSS